MSASANVPGADNTLNAAQGGGCLLRTVNPYSTRIGYKA